jgi:hypothetical protein
VGACPRADPGADRGYDGWWYRQEPALRGIADGIMAGDYWRRLLDAAGRARNRAIGKVRAPVERSFATMKRWYGYRRVRYRSLVPQCAAAAAAGPRPEPAPRPGADLLRAESAAATMARAAVMVAKATVIARPHRLHLIV